MPYARTTRLAAIAKKLNAVNAKAERDLGPGLLEASKEMLAAIKAVAKEHLDLRKLESHLHELDRAEEKLRATIAKAEGQA